MKQSPSNSCFYYLLLLQYLKMPCNSALGAQNPLEIEKYYNTCFANGKLHQREMKLIIQLERKSM